LWLVLLAPNRFAFPSRHESGPKLRDRGTESGAHEKEHRKTGSSTPTGALFRHVNTPPAKAGGFGLRLKAGSVGHPADYTT
jgi:hypothetical protein